MKLTIDTKEKTITLLEQVEIIDLVLFLEGMNIAEWKIIPHVEQFPYTWHPPIWEQPYNTLPDWHRPIITCNKSEVTLTSLSLLVP